MTNQEIIDKLGLGNLPKEVQDETLTSINHVVELRVMGLVDDMMSDEQRATFEQKTAEAPESVWNWISAEFTDVDKLYEAALVDYLDEKTK
jgi:hypothetical protein